MPNIKSFFIFNAQLGKHVMAKYKTFSMFGLKIFDVISSHGPLVTNDKSIGPYLSLVNLKQGLIELL